MKNKRNKIIFTLSVIGMIAIWQIISMLINSEILLPSPYSTLKAFVKMIVTIDYWIAIGSTVMRGFLAVAISIIVGVGLGIAMGFSDIVKMIFLPYIKLIQAIPPISWIIIAMIWFHYEIVPIFVMSLNLIPIMTINTMNGIDEIDPKIIEMSNLYRLSRKTKFVIYLGSILPYILSGTAIVLGQAWKVSSIAETISNPTFGIGRKLKWSLSNLEIVDTFVWTVSIIIISAIFNKLLSIIRGKIEKWKRK
jgi:NitT/TauT family transport system permease protein